MEHQEGIEPSGSPWKGVMLPLHHWCLYGGRGGTRTHERLSTLTRFPGGLLSQLGHSSSLKWRKVDESNTTAFTLPQGFKPCLAPLAGTFLNKETRTLCRYKKFSESCFINFLECSLKLFSLCCF